MNDRDRTHNSEAFRHFALTFLISVLLPNLVFANPTLRLRIHLTYDLGRGGDFDLNATFVSNPPNAALVLETPLDLGDGRVVRSIQLLPEQIRVMGELAYVTQNQVVGLPSREHYENETGYSAEAQGYYRLSTLSVALDRREIRSETPTTTEMHAGFDKILNTNGATSIREMGGTSVSSSRNIGDLHRRGGIRVRPFDDSDVQTALRDTFRDLVQSEHRLEQGMADLLRRCGFSHFAPPPGQQ